MKIRPVTPEDLDDIVRMNKVCGFPERSKAGWDWVLFQNPHQGDEPPGYVGERDGAVTAFLGCAGRKLIQGSNTICASMGHTFVSDLAAPGIAARLIKHYFANCSADLYTLNNNALSAPIYKRRGAKATWGERGQQYLEKRLDMPRILASAALRRIAKRETLHHRLARREWFLQKPNLGAQDAVDGVRLIVPSIASDAAVLDAFQERLASSGKIYGARGSELWSYRLSDPDRAVAPLLHGVFDAEGLSGLLVTSVSKDVEFGVPTLEIEDLVWVEGKQSALTPLLAQAETHAAHAKAARILWRVLPKEDVTAITEPRGYTLRSRGYDSCHSRLSGNWDGADWAASGIDGDFWFALRRPPAG